MKTKEWIKLVSILLLCTFIFGFFIMVFPKIPILGGTSDGWLGYWGGIIGSILGIVGAVLVFSRQLEVEKERARVQNVDNTFFNLLNLHNEVYQNVQEINKVIYDSMLQEREKHRSTESKKQILSDRINILKKSDAKKLVKIIGLMENSIPNQIKGHSQYLENLSEVKQIIEGKKYEKYKDQIKVIQFILSPKIVLTDMDYFEIDRLENIRDTTLVKDLEEWAYDSFIDEVSELNYFYKIIFNNYIYDYIEQDQFLNGIKQSVKSVSYRKLEMNQDVKNKIIESSLAPYYDTYGNYFRIFHRLIKYINENVNELELKRNYIGITRAMVSQRDMLLIFYNSFYSKRGEGLKRELLFTNFFGDEEDFTLEKQYTQHFDNNLLLWKESDLDLMKSCKLKLCPRE